MSKLVRTVLKFTENKQQIIQIQAYYFLKINHNLNDYIILVCLQLLLAGRKFHIQFDNNS